MSCKDCQKRYVGCHSECEEYQAFRKDYEEQKEKRKQEKLLPIKSANQVRKIERYQKRYGK